MASLYKAPDIDLLQQSSNTLWSCCAGGNTSRCVIDVKVIKSVVAMVPHSTSSLGAEWEGRFFVVEKPGLDVAEMGGITEVVADE